MHRKQRETPRDSRWRLTSASAMVAAAALLVLLRFPPADLAGWAAVTLGAPLGVPYLLACALCLVSVWLLRESAEGPQRALARIGAAGATVTCIIGVLLICTPPPTAG